MYLVAIVLTWNKMYLHVTKLGSLYLQFVIMYM